MKTRTKLLMNSLWYKKKIHNPYQVISEAFSNNDIVALKKFVEALFKSSCQKKPCTVYSFANIIFYLEQLESLINAGYLISLQKGSQVVRSQDFNLFDPLNFCGRHKYLTAWDYIPKNLSSIEYTNPILALNRIFRFCSIGDWKKRIKLVSTYAFDSGTLYDDVEKIDVLNNYQHLSGLLEAVHVIEIRQHSQKQ